MTEPEPIFKDCRSLQDSPYDDLEGDHNYRVSEDLYIQVQGGTMVFTDEDGNFSFLISEHDFGNFVDKYYLDRVKQTVGKINGRE
jgi:hypothetical protein